MTSWFTVIGKVRRNRRGIRREDGFALIATLIILAATSIIILGLLSYTMATVNFAADQTLRDKQVAAGDGALNALVNQMTGDTTARLGALGTYCTPDLVNHANEEDKKFNYTIDGTRVQVSCEPVSSGLPPTPVDSNLPDVVNVIGDGTGYTGEYPLSAACSDSDRNQPTCPHWEGAVGGQTNSTVASTNQSLTHVGPSALWFVANQLRVTAGSAALRSPLICDSAASGCNPGLPAGPASGATGTYVQGRNGIFKSVDPTSPDGTNCGILQQASSVPSAQVITPTAQRTVCGDSVTAGLKYDSGSGVVPDAPVSLSGTVIGTPEWVQAHRVTKLADSAGTTIAGHDACPASAWTPTAGSLKPIQANIITFNPGAYTRLEMATMNKWMSGTCQGVIYWFKPGDYWLDMNDNGNTQLKMTAARSYMIFGTPFNGTIENTDLLNPPLCDTQGPGVSITLSQRTSIYHTKGRVAICGAAGRPAIYQSTQANLGWTANPTAGSIGTTSTVSSPGNGFAQLFKGWTSATPNNPVLTFRGFGGGGIDAKVGCNGIVFPGASFCQSRTLLTLDLDNSEGNNSYPSSTPPGNPGHIPISTAVVRVGANLIGGSGDDYAPETSTSVGVFLKNNATSTPDCGVYYKGVPDSETLAFDLLDSTKQPAGVPPCSKVIHYADELYTANIGVNFIVQSPCDFQLFNGCGDVGVHVNSAAVSVGWTPLGSRLICTGVSDGGFSNNDGRTSCTGKDNDFIGSLTRSSSTDVVLGRNVAQVKVSCGHETSDGDVAAYIFSFTLGGERPDDRCGGPVTANYKYAISDLSSPDYASLTNAAAGISAKSLTSLGVMVKGSSYCLKSAHFILPTSPSTCGPHTTSWRDDTVWQSDQQEVAPGSSPTQSWKNWDAAASGGGAGITVSIVPAGSSAAVCATNAHLPEHDETMYVSLPIGQPGCAITKASDLSTATVNVQLRLSRDNDTENGCNNGKFIFVQPQGNSCREWGYNLDWVGLEATSASTTPTADYVGPPMTDRLTQYASASLADQNGALFNVYGQVILPRADLDVLWNGPTMTTPLISGGQVVAGTQRRYTTAGQPTFVVKSIHSATTKSTKWVNPGDPPDVVARKLPTVGVICCGDFTQSSRYVNLVARLPMSDPTDPGGLLATAVVEVFDAPTKKVVIHDWRLCNRGRTATACDT